MNIFGQGMWRGLNNATGTYLNQANLMAQDQERKREFDAQQALRAAAEARRQEAFEQAQNLRKSQEIFGRAIMTGQVDNLMENLSDYVQSPGPRADVSPEVQTIAQKLPVNMMMDYRSGEYMPYDEKRLWELQKYRALHPKKTPQYKFQTIYDDKTGKSRVVAINPETLEQKPIGAGKPAYGKSITVAPDGSIQFSEGQGIGGMSPEITKGLAGNLGNRIANIGHDLDLAEVLLDQFDPDYFKWPQRFGWDVVYKTLDKMGTPPKGFEESFDKYKQYGTLAIGRLNQIIKNLAGAAVSEAEEKRMLSGIPDFGAEWWKGDSPKGFYSKLTSTIRQARMAQARYRYFLKNGFIDPKRGDRSIKQQITQLVGQNPNFRLDNMKQLISQETERFLEDLVLKNPGADPKTLLPLAIKQASDFFGVDLTKKRRR